MRIKPYALLMLSHDVVGVRFLEKYPNNDWGYFDIDAKALGVSKDKLASLALERLPLVENNGMYMTEAELSGELVVKDRTDEVSVLEFCKKFMQGYEGEKDFNKEVSKKKDTKQKKKFKGVVTVDWYDPMQRGYVKKEFELEVYADNALKAIKEIKDIYESELGVEREAIKVKVKPM